MWTHYKLFVIHVLCLQEVWIKQPGEGAWSKRQCTIHLTIFGPGGPPPCAIVVFRGQGKRIRLAERTAYHPLVHVLFQPKAWVNLSILLLSVPILKSHIKTWLEAKKLPLDKPFLHTFDNLS